MSDHFETLFIYSQIERLPVGGLLGRLLIAHTYKRCVENVSITSNLLQSLGFIIHKNKCEFKPSKSCRFLGFIFNTEEFAISTPPDKRKKLLQMTLGVLNRNRCKIRFLASFIGSLISVCPAVLYGLLHIKILEREKFLALTSSDNNFEAQMPLSTLLKEDFLWWKAVFSERSQRNFNRSGLFALEIFSDASLTGWGAAYRGTRTHGFWSLEDKKSHINYLKLLAPLHVLRCFASHLKGSDILLRTDNTTAISYINRMGSIKFPRLSGLAREIWSWCMERNLFIYVSYIPSVQNFDADAESRVVSEETKWSVTDIPYFDKIAAHFGPFDINLFATSINTKCPNFVSWHPDPLAQAVDAFSLAWGDFYFYAFPPFILILRVLRKIITDKAEDCGCTLVASPAMVSPI